MRIVRLLDCPIVRLAAVVLVAGSAFAWEGPKLTRNKSAQPVSRTWSSVKESIAQSIAKTGDGYFAYSRKFNDLGPIDTAGTLTDEELHTQFAMACVLASPITVNGGTVKPQLEKWLQDKTLMNVNGDMVARQGHVVAERDGTFVILKYLWGMNDANNAVAFYNPTDESRRIAVTARELSLTGTVKWTDRFDESQKGSFEHGLAFDVPAHGTRLVHVSGKPVMRGEYRRECAVRESGGLVWRDVFVPRDGTYSLLVGANGNAPYRVKVNGLDQGEFRGAAHLKVTLYNPENRVQVSGAGADGITAIHVACEDRIRDEGEVRSRYEDELYNRVVPFWQEHSEDRACGGYLTCLDREGRVYDTFKDMWLEWREVYMFAALYNRGRKDRAWLDLANRGFDFLFAKGRGPDGVYPARMNRDGSEKVQGSGGVEVFTHGFAAMAAAELFRATGEGKYREEAESCWRIYRRLAAANETKYRQLAHRVIGLNVLNVFWDCLGPGRQDEAERMIAEIRRFVEPRTGLLFERVRADWSFDLDSQYGRFVNSGHTVEMTSFLFDYIMKSGRKEHLDFACKIALRMFDFGWDAGYGGGFVYRDALDKPVDKTDWMLKTWWANCEAATAMLRGWRLTGDWRFFDRFCLIDEYDWKNFRDPDFPEWFAYAPVEGRLIHSYKGNVRKGFFHLPRRLLDCIELLR